MLPLTAGYAVNLFATPFVLSKLGLHDFGIWSITGAIAQYAALLDLGVSRAANRYVAFFHAKGDRKSEGAVVGICVTALLLLGAVLTGLTFLFAQRVDSVLSTSNPDLARLLLLCAVFILIFGLLARVLAAASVGRGRLVPAGLGIAILSVLQAVSGVAALIMQPTLRAFAIGNVIGTAIGLAVVVVIILVDERRLLIGFPRMALTHEVLVYGVNSQVAAAGDLLLMQSGKLIAGILIGPSAAAVYDLASRLAMGAQAFGGASASALTPHLTRSYVSNGLNGILSQYERLTRRNTAVTVFLPFAMIATAVSAIPLWLGHATQQVTVMLLALLAGIVVNVSTGVCTSSMSALGRPGITAVVTLTLGLLQASFAVLMTLSLGFPGLAAAFAVGVPLTKFIGVWWMQSRVGIPNRLYIRGFAVHMLRPSLLALSRCRFR